MTNLGTLFAFVLVCIGIWIMRKTNPGQARPFRAPSCRWSRFWAPSSAWSMIISVDPTSKIAAGTWMVIGLAVYFVYAKSHSNLGKPGLASEVARHGD